ncbi:unnamed protein product [Oikopleura dioica]|uniref:Kinesin motor domain-containing protein n=1 Tax=Oikopleura dioica TaxID=34765 RepID=E4WY48_OIKDI|nr:unnamed protein product [Oikopleura dioica]
MLTDAVESIKGEKQEAQTQAKGLQEYKMMREAEFDNLEERLQNAQRELRKLKNELESTSDSLDETQKRLKSVKLERDSLQEDFEGAGKKIDQLKRKIELQEDDLKKIEHEKENLLENKREMREKMDAMEDERRTLHETIQQLKGNIRVFVRVRPLLPKELEEKHSSEHISFENALDKGIEITREDKKEEKAEFQFDAVFKPDSTQIQIFGEVSQLVRSSLDGYNVTIFAYGQTGSGKTFSMEGPEDVYENEEMQGIIPRSFEFLIEAVEKSKEKGWIYKLEASYLEVYCEELNDLLEGGEKKLKIEGTGSKHINVANLSRHEITSKPQLSNLVKRANKRRKTASTNCNERSSRSHSVFILFISGENTRNGQKIESCLNLVDLAGSERVKESGATGQRFEEAKKINGSLSSLGDVIASLGSKSKHIPYRNSKLTHLLQNSLGGNSKTLMIMHVNPRKLYANESYNTLRFAQKVNTTNIGTAQKKVQEGTFSGQLPDEWSESCRASEGLLLEGDEACTHLWLTGIFIVNEG